MCRRRSVKISGRLGRSGRSERAGGVSGAADSTIDPPEAWRWQSSPEILSFMHFAHHVSRPASRMNQSQFAISFQLAAQIANIFFQYVGCALEVIAPDTIHDDVAGEHLARTAHKQRQQLVFR